MIPLPKYIKNIRLLIGIIGTLKTYFSKYSDVNSTTNDPIYIILSVLVRARFIRHPFL